jgi:hypothetical protein
VLAFSAAPALAATGSISGKVTAASSHEPIAGIEVCAVTTAILNPELEKQIEEGLELGSEQYGCTTTGATGEYTVSGLGAGGFFVGFANPFLGTLNYVAQFYNGTTSFEAAATVTVTAGSTTAHIDAELQEGGEFSGTITSAATGAPVEGALVCALPVPLSSTREGACGRTTAAGAYAVVGLEAGAYAVVAFALGFNAVYDGGAGTFAEAAPLTVALKEDHGGLNIALTPRLSPPPGSAGEGAPGESGAGGGSPLGGSGPSGHPKGSATGVGLANALIKERRRSVVVRLTCHSTQRCRGKIWLTATRRIRRAHRHVEKTVAIGSARYSARSGHNFAVTIRLSRAAAALLKAARGHLPASLRIVQKAPRPAQTTVKRVLLLGAHRAKHKPGAKHKRSAAR